jgi:hypothetical protein
VGQKSYRFLALGYGQSLDMLQSLGYVIENNNVYVPRDQVTYFFLKFPEAELKLEHENHIFRSAQDLLAWEKENKIEVACTKPINPFFAWGVPGEEPDFPDPKFGLG